MEKIDIRLFLYKIRYVLYTGIIIFILFWAFNSINNKKQKLYNSLATYKNVAFLIQNGNRKTKTLSENYIRNVFSAYKIQLDYVKTHNGLYQIKAQSINAVILAKIIYQIEKDGFKISYLKAQDYSGNQNFDIHMEISP